METLIFHERLDDFKEIEKLLIESKVLMNPYAIESQDAYKLENYLINSDQKVSCLLDRNIVSYLIELVKGIELSPDFNQSRCHRLAAALQAFFNAAHIQSEPGLSYHEYIDNSSIEQADEELSYYRAADNLNANIYLDIALNKINSVPRNSVSSYGAGELSEFDGERKLKPFEFNIVVVKKGLSIRSECNSDYEAIRLLLEWMFEEYVFCAPAFYFMAIYFSSRRVANMLKSKSLKSVRNAAWDLAVLQHWITVANKDTESLWFLASMDKAINQVANLMLLRSAESLEDYYERLEQDFAAMWGKKSGNGRKLLERFCFWCSNTNSPKRKAYWPDNNNSEYMLNLRKSVHEEYLNKVVS